ncbi:autotransporter outer membrane beta-barrel domain-containing protein [Anaerovibrio lipolyticus]|uniref:autotransporter outer membrane beta-barrel domain-containing protein n=1 Tax=Anaerovibrio lipolyticus TaxID=82374 RepID=UPI0012DFAFB8|nr:autotransporter outer membrane beta-barrel domain-containing protein [Anaerovibrio lipolyticus]
MSDWSGDPNNNTVTMTGGNITYGGVFGAYIENETSVQSATGNQVNVSGGTIEGNVLAGAAVYRGAGNNNVENNTVTVSGTAAIKVDIYGALTSNGTANNNHVLITGGNVNNNGSRRICGGLSNYGGDATNNTVTISGGTVNVGSIIGGSLGETIDWTTGDPLYNLTGKATGNQVIINGASVKADIKGGWRMPADYDASAAVTGNIVTLNGATVTGRVFGGYCNNDNYNGAVDIVTGNTLNLSGANTVSGMVKNFETINIKSATWGTPALTLAGDGILANTGGGYPTINANAVNVSGVANVKAGHTTKLIEGGMGAYAGTIASGPLKSGSTLEVPGTTAKSGNDLVFTASGDVQVQEQTHNTVMGAEVGMAALSAGNDFVGAATEGLAMAGNAGADGLATYANMGGGSMNVETGSHVKTHTWNAILALGHKNEKKLSTTEYGAFFEYGTGNYTTFNGAERGDGSTHYTGGGILGKWQKNNGFYVEGSLRAGSIHDDATNVLRDVNGNPYSYDTDATYWGAHIGVGREIKLNKTDILDLYAKYFYNHRGSVSFDAGGHYDLDAVESSVLRIGTRYTVKKNDKVNFYGGLALEHEFCGRAAGTADGVAIRGADISGTSVRGEIGATFQPGDNSPVTLDLNLSGFAGKKRGLTGGLSAVFHF